MKDEFGNTNSKDIWENHLLCAQFLRNYSGISLLENVQPEDITDETEKFRLLIGVEFEGDAVKKIQIHLSEGQPVYVVALLEHKSKVDHDIALQLLKYMVGIWIQHRNDRNRECPGISHTKDFRYPLVIPIVYYEGQQSWTAAMHWGDRVEFSGMFGEYVPDFTYRVINLHKYTNEEILSNGDEISLVMLFNRMQTMEDLNISLWPEEQRQAAQRILQKTPETVVHLLAQMVHHFGHKLNAPDEEIMECVRQVEDKNMGELWADMEKMDIQAERRNTAEAREQLAEAMNTIAGQEQTIARLMAEIKKLTNQ